MNDDLAGHPGVGASWEGFVVAQIRNQLPRGGIASMYRTAAGAQLDLVVETGRPQIGYQVILSTAPQVTKGLRLACGDVGVNRTAGERRRGYFDAGVAAQTIGIGN